VETIDERRARPLIITTDESLLDDVLRLAAAAGTMAEVASDVSAARRWWGTAGMVVVGDDLAGAIAEVRLPRRDGVVLATQRRTDTRVWAHAVAIGAGEVLVLPDAQSVLIDLLGDCLEGGAGGGVSVGVIGGCGGSGASTFAAALAQASAAQGRETLVADADPLGGGIDLVLGAEQEPGLRWPDLAGTSGRLSAPTLRDALPRAGQLSILSWDRGGPVPVTAGAMRSVLSAAARGHELVVVDLPRRLDPAAEEAVAQVEVLLLVVPGELRAVAAASRVLAGLRDLVPRTGLVVRTCGGRGLDAQRVAESLALPIWATMGPDKGVGPALDEGLGPLRRRRSPLASCCHQVLKRVTARSAAA